ncbi:hypothetical protein RRG08_048130 [Elysia crispata]|uniref:Uncharacterized protein n=1 Tax=Elysia crispata TaxID=231223 RepID=A0AAE1DGK6_9GAST|nr:hypothetical protein RRG08_048130 [Elysia crispata]
MRHMYQGVYYPATMRHMYQGVYYPATMRHMYQGVYYPATMRHMYQGVYYSATMRHMYQGVYYPATMRHMYQELPRTQSVGESLPVMYGHGGRFRDQSPVYFDHTSLPLEGVVVVTINYM